MIMMKIKIIIIKKSEKLEKIHWSMKHKVMIKIVATGTGETEMVIGLLLRVFLATGFVMPVSL